MKPSEILERKYKNKLVLVVKLTKQNIKQIISDYTKAKTTPFYVDVISDRFRESMDNWSRELEIEGYKVAKELTDKSLGVVDKNLKRDFSKASLSIDFQMTEKMKSKIQSKINENVGLIKSLPQEYLQKAQGTVMRCIERGSDLKTLSEELEHRYGIEKRRAVNIAKDQAKKATSTFNRQRQLDVGIKKAIWVHSGMGKEVRLSHVKAGREKLVFDLEKGALIDGEHIFPSEKVNCRCTWVAYLGDFD